MKRDVGIVLHSLFAASEALLEIKAKERGLHKVRDSLLAATYQRLGTPFQIPYHFHFKDSL